jgi:hypothetical protein
VQLGHHENGSLVGIEHCERAIEQQQLSTLIRIALGAMPFIAGAVHDVFGGADERTRLAFAPMRRGRAKGDTRQVRGWLGRAWHVATVSMRDKKHFLHQIVDIRAQHTHSREEVRDERRMAAKQIRRVQVPSI